MKKKNLRFYFTIITVKIATALMKLVGKNATHLPGWIANKMCPNFISYMEKPDKLVFITGTNGKTTVSNLVADVLKSYNYEFINNSTGSNIRDGIVSALLTKTSFLGKNKSKLAVLEVDERYAPKIYPYLPPDFLVCTNLFRDSYRRNAHSEFIFNILNSQIPETTKLILNGEDLISSRLASDNPRCHFGINFIDTKASSDNIIKDIIACPHCGALLSFDYIRYNHIGRGHCTNCDFGSPDLDYSIDHIDYDKGTCLVSTPSGNADFKLLGDNITDAYNMIAAISCLMEMGLSLQDIKKSFDNIKVVSSRFNQEIIGNKKIIRNLAKGQNPIACSRVCDFIRHQEGNKAVILILDDIYDAKESSENDAWIYDVDFEFLNNDDIKQIICSGVRNKDFQLRLLMAGIPKEKIKCCEKEIDSASFIDYDEVDTICIMHDIHAGGMAKTIVDNIAKALDKENVAQ
ncbi:MAG: DUF1727 domain-containing protein [Lachnospiraceae bacterium]|nr:DUF1727 domain-containing protein [Lachnospiraceae bacterium]